MAMTKFSTDTVRDPTRVPFLSYTRRALQRRRSLIGRTKLLEAVEHEQAKSATSWVDYTRSLSMYQECILLMYAYNCIPKTLY